MAWEYVLFCFLKAFGITLFVSEETRVCFPTDSALPRHLWQTPRGLVQEDRKGARPEFAFSRFNR
jgi:hypothetical protein